MSETGTEFEPSGELRKCAEVPALGHWLIPTNSMIVRFWGGPLFVSERGASPELIPHSGAFLIFKSWNS